MAQNLGSLIINIESNTTQLVQGFNRAENSVNKATKSMANGIKALVGAYVSLSAVDLARSYARQVDELTSVNSRLKLVTKSTQEFTTAQTELYKIAQDTRQSFSGTIDLFARVARSTQQLGLSQKELLGITDSINKAMIISGGTAESQQAALIQLGQAFQADFKAVGQELGSLREQAPRLYEAMVKGMNVTSDQFKKLAEDGKLSSKQIIEALRSQGIVLNEEFSKIDMTIGQSMVTAKNAVQNFIFEFDKITGISSGVSSNIRELSNSIDNLSPEKVAELTEYIKNGTIAIVSMYTALKVGKLALEGYSAISQASLKVEDARNKLLDIQSKNLKAKELAELATMKTANSYNLITREADFQTQAQIKNTKALQSELMKKSVVIEKTTAKQSKYIESLENTAKGFSLATIGANAFKYALTTIPLIAISVAISAIATSLSNTSKELDILDETLNSPIEKLKELSRTQLEYRKTLIGDDIKKSNVALFEAQYQLNLFNSKLEDNTKLTDEQKKKRLELANNIETEKQKLTDLQFTYEDINNILVDFTKTGTKVKQESGKDLKPLNDGLQNILDATINIKKEFAEYRKELQDSGQATPEKLKLLDEKEAEKLKALNVKNVKEEKKSLDERISQYANYYEKTKDYANLWAIEEQKLRQDNTALTTQELNKLINIEKEAFNQRLKLNQDLLNVEDWKNYYIKIGEFEYAWQIELSENYDKWKQLAGEKLPELVDIYKKEFYDKIQAKEIKPFEFDIDLDSFDTPITNALKSFDKLNEATQEYNKYIKQSGLTKEEIAKADEKNLSNQLKGYSNIAGAIGGLFDEGSKESATFKVAQTALALVEGTRAVLSALANGDPYTAIPRAIAVGAMVSSLLSNIGVAFGMNTISVSSDAFSSMSANTGTGTVLGDSKKASESITNALSTLEDFAQPQYQTLVSMNKYLESIASALGGVTSLLIRQGGFAFGAGYTGFDTGFKNNISANNLTLGLLNPIQSVISKIPVVGQITGLFGNVINSVLGGVFGKTKTYQDLTDSGIYFANQLLTNAINDFTGSAFQTITTTVTKKSWFSKSTSTYVNSYFQALDDETERQFSLVLSNLYNTVLIAGQELDETEQQIKDSLSNFVVSIGKISLLGKTGDQIKETLESIFGSIGDQIAATAFPALIPFQQVGEGLFETLTRVATGMEESNFFIDRLGTSTVKYTDIINKQGVVGFEALAQSIIKSDEAIYGLNNGVVQMIDNLDSTTEELYATYISFGNIRDILESTSQSASSLSSSMVTGAGSISALESGTKSYMENFLSDSERLNIELDRLREQFQLAGYEMPNTRQGFIDLINSIDTSTEEGAKAYGRLITLSDSYNDTITEIEDNLTSLITTFSNLGDSVAQTIKTLAGADNNAMVATNQIKDFWEKRKEIDTLLALNGNLTESQQSRLSELVSEVNSLATNIQSSSGVSSNITGELITNLTQLKDNLNLENQILSVNIVGVASNISLIDSLVGSTTTAPTLTTISSNNVTSSEISTEIKDILTTIKDNIYIYPKRTYELLDNVINGNQRVKVQS